MSSADLLLHPVRLRIVQAFLGDRELTTNDLCTELADVAVATLYRQIAILVDGDVLQVVAERKVRGAVERTYQLNVAKAGVNADDAAAMSSAEHHRAFLTFVASLLADFDRYLATGDIDFARDMVGYRQAALYVTDDELTTVIDDVRRALAPHADHPPKGRRRVILSTVLMPTSPAPQQAATTNEPTT